METVLRKLFFIPSIRRLFSLLFSGVVDRKQRAPLIDGATRRRPFTIMENNFLDIGVDKPIIKQNAEPISKVTSSAGRSWLMKSLDPSLEFGQRILIPDSPNSYLVPLEVKVTQNFTIPVNSATNTWNFDGYMLPHPIVLGSFHSSDSESNHNEWTNLQNETLAGTADYEKYASFAALAEQYRISYQSATYELICTDLTNEGTVKAVQFPFPPSTYYIDFTDNCDGLNTKISLFVTGDDIPYESMDSTKNSFISQAREGCYQVMKLGKDCRKFKRVVDNTLYTYMASNIYDVTLGCLGPGVTGDPILTGGPPIFVNSPVTWNNDDGMFVPGRCLPTPHEYNVGKVAFRGIDKSATVRVTIRLGMELIVRPATTYAPLIEPGGIMDQNALSIHDAIWNTMGDGYPAAYNDGKKLLRFLYNAGNFVASKIFPVLKNTPFAPIVSGVEQLGGMIGKKIKKKLDKEAAKETPKVSK